MTIVHKRIPPPGGGNPSSQYTSDRRATTTLLPTNPNAYWKLRAALLVWFDRCRRELPWRADRDPYRVWISEIMLQQTRVGAVVEHYIRFLKKFPDVQALARSRTSTVLAAWSGLGYYRRARLLHAAARQIVLEREGHWPRSAAEWRTLPGVGRYTAAAIASISQGEPCAVVDGNVERVLARMLGPGIADPWLAAEGLLSRGRPGDFNQAIMELGAMICTPRAPRCPECPLRPWCQTAAGLRAPTAAAAQSRKRAEVTCCLAVHGERVLLVQRSEDETVMPGMWELPPLPSTATKQRRQKVKPVSFVVRHAIMDTDYSVSVVETEAAPIMGQDFHGGRWVPVNRIAKLPLTGLTRKILKRAKVIRNSTKHQAPGTKPAEA